MSTGHASFGDVVRDIGVFIEGWFAELFLGGFYDAELEKTHANALFVLLLPGLLLLGYNLIPFVKRGNEFRVEPDGSVVTRAGAMWSALLEHEYSDHRRRNDDRVHTAAGARAGSSAAAGVSREYGVRLPGGTSAEFFRRRLTGRGFEIDESSASSCDHFTARRKP